MEQQIATMQKRTKFSETEDGVLRGLVSRLGDDWVKIAEEHKSTTKVDRLPKELRDRYVNYLSNYTVIYPPLSAEGKNLLNELVEKFGSSWKIFRDKIARFFPMRTAGNLYNSYKSDNRIKTRDMKYTQEELISLWKITNEYSNINSRETIFNAQNDVEYRKWDPSLSRQNTKFNKMEKGILDPSKVFDQNSLQVLGLSQNNFNSTIPHSSIEDYSITSLLNPQKLELKPIDGSFIHNFNIPPLMPKQQNQEI